MTLVIQPYSEARYEALLVVLKNKGLTLSGDQGEVKRAGADVKFDEENGMLILNVEKPPFWHTMDSFCEELTQLANGIPNE